MSWLDKPLAFRQTSSSLAYDYFISHTSEEKDALVRPLAEGLKNRRVPVWYDEFTLKIGEGLRASIDKVLASSRCDIGVLSPDVIAKDWTKYELNGLTTRQIMGQQTILPIWQQI